MFFASLIALYLVMFLPIVYLAVIWQEPSLIIDWAIDGAVVFAIAFLVMFLISRLL